MVTGASGRHLGEGVKTDLRRLADEWTPPGWPRPGPSSTTWASGYVVAAHGRLGNHAEAVSLAQQLVSADPLVERTHRTLLRALAAAADRGAAVRAFDRYRTLLADELGVDPSDETVAVYLEAIGGADPAGGASVPAPIGGFAGRGGVGKSRLAAEATRARGRDGGSSWVSLATVADDPLVDATVALRLGITTPAEDQAAALVWTRCGHCSPRASTVVRTATPC